MPTDVIDDYVQPLLFRNATTRAAGPEMPGRYDVAERVWLVETENGAVPLVGWAPTALIETSTTTRVRQEGDDEDSSMHDPAGGTDLTGLAALATKTAVQQESDDEAIGASALEFETRSLNNNEGIDDDWPLVTEFETRTFVENEGDDDSTYVH